MTLYSARFFTPKLPAMTEKYFTLRATSSRPVSGDTSSPPLARSAARLPEKPTETTTTELSGSAASSRRYIATGSSQLPGLRLRLKSGLPSEAFNSQTGVV